jgi:hypothetical protein
LSSFLLFDHNQQAHSCSTASAALELLALAAGRAGALAAFFGLALDNHCSVDLPHG